MNSKKTISTVLVLNLLVITLAAGFTGCGSTPAGAEQNPEVLSAIEMAKGMTLHGSSVKTGQKPEFLLVDGIETISNTRNEYGDDFYASYETISGLKNKSIEGRVNSAIEDKVMDMLFDTNLPKVYGSAIKEREYKENGVQIRSNVYSYTMYSYNNVLSVSFYQSITANLDAENYIYDYYYKADTLNFDLNTGEELTLGDVFPDGFDYITYCNDYVNEFALKAESDEYFYDDTTGQSGSVGHNFETIWPDAKFTISAYGNTVNILADCETPGFECMSDYIYFTVPLEDNNALYDRFVGEDNLYIKDTCYALQSEANSYYVSDYYYENDQKDMSEYIDVKKENYISSNIKIPNYIPESILEMAKDYYENDDAYLNKLEDFYNEVYYNVDEPWLMSGWGNRDISASRIGKFYTLSVYESADLWDYDYSKSFSDNTVKTFDKEGNELQLEDLFADGVDCQQLILDTMYYGFYRDALEKHRNDRGDWLWNIYEEYGEKLQSLAGMLYDDICGFSLNTDGITLYYNDKDAVIRKWLGPKEATNDTVIDISNNYAWCLYFKDLGCENLTVF